MTRSGIRTALACLALLICQFALAVGGRADVLLQGFYWDVPSPQTGQADAPWWWDNLAVQAHALRQAGFTYMWLPPVVKGANAHFSVGYDPFDDYDIGGKDQHGFVPSRYGTREQLERCVAMLRANGLNVVIDLVENHRDGDLNLFFNYKDAFGNPTGGRFAKTPDDFHHDSIVQDPDVPEEVGNQIGMFGPDLAPINGKDHHAFDGLIDAGDWLTRALDVQGYRLDYVKGISTDWLLPFLNSKSMKGKWAVGEFFDGDLGKVSHWVHDSMKDRASAFDFPLRGLLKQMCDQNGQFDMQRLDHAGLAGSDPFRAVTFVENHDTDHDNNNHIVQGKMLAYAYILTSEGLPAVFYRDYSMDAGSYHLKPLLDKLILIHETLASGTTQQRWKDGDIFAYERLGGPHLLTALNDNPNNARAITVDTGFGPNKMLHDYADHAPDIQTDAQGKATLTVPANKDGAGYVCYAPAGRSLRLPVRAFSVTQDYEGAPDLDIKPADNTLFVPVCRIWAAKGKRIRAALTCDTTAWTPQTRVTLQIQGPSDAVPLVRIYSADTNGAAWNNIAKQTGWHTFTIRASDTPDTNARPSYRLHLTYNAPQVME
jgi:alpha-amylase